MFPAAPHNHPAAGAPDNACADVANRRSHQESGNKHNDDRARDDSSPSPTSPSDHSAPGPGATLTTTPERRGSPGQRPFPAVLSGHYRAAVLACAAWRHRLKAFGGAIARCLDDSAAVEDGSVCLLDGHISQLVVRFSPRSKSDRSSPPASSSTPGRQTRSSPEVRRGALVASPGYALVGCAAQPTRTPSTCRPHHRALGRASGLWGHPHARGVGPAQGRSARRRA